MAGIGTCETSNDGLSDEGLLRNLQLSMESRVQESDRIPIYKSRCVLTGFELSTVIFHKEW